MASSSIQQFFANSIPTAVDKLEAAYQSLPEGKRSWSPQGSARTALDQVTEVAILNGIVAGVIESAAWPVGYDVSLFPAEKAAWVAKGFEEVRTLLHANTKKVAEAAANCPDDRLEVEIELPWTKMKVAEILAYPYWNAIYHEGQINYIASLVPSEQPS